MKNSTHRRHSKDKCIADKGLPTSHFQNMYLFQDEKNAH